MKPANAAKSLAEARILAHAVVRQTRKAATMNREEAAFAAHLAADPGVAWWAFEPMKLSLAANTSYTPDFIAIREVGAIHAYDVKALWKGKAPADDRVGWQEDARVKIKCAAEAFPWIHFFGVHRDRNGVWQIEEFAP